MAAKPSSDSSWRPDYPERQRRLDEAKRLVKERRWLAARPDRLWKDLNDLGLYTQEEINAALDSALAEIQPRDYRGAFPPEESVEDECKGAELFPFAWDSETFGRTMYVKFAFVPELVIVSLHGSRRKKKTI